MGWKRRPTRGTSWAAGRPPARRFRRTAPWPFTTAVAILALAAGIAVPLLGISLVIFLAFDTVLGIVKNRRQHTGTGAN